MDISIIHDFLFGSLLGENLQQAFLGAVMGGLALGKLALGAAQSIGANKKLRELHEQPYPEYKEHEAMGKSRQRAEGLARQGYTADERAAFQEQLRRGQNTGYRRAVEQAPGLSQSIFAGINRSNIQAQLGFAAQDAALHRQNIRYADTFSANLQRISDANITEQISARRQAEEELGKGARSFSDSLGEIFETGMGLASAGIGEAGGFGALGFGSKKKH